MWLWAALAIADRQKQKYKDIEANLDLIIITHSMFLLFLACFKCYKCCRSKNVDLDDASKEQDLNAKKEQSSDQ